MASGIDIIHVYQHLGVSVALWVLVILAVLIDLWDGVYTAKRLHQRVHSHKLRVTIRKIGEYWRFILMGFIADSVGILFPFWAWPYLSIVICLAIVGIEAKSVKEHADKRKSRVSEIPEMVQKIVKCTSKEDALNLLIKLKHEIDSDNRKYNFKENENYEA